MLSFSHSPSAVHASAISESSSSGAATQAAPMNPTSARSSQIAGLPQFELAWAGTGTSIHCDTGDETLWSRVRISFQLDWSGRCTLIGSGVSVVRRDMVGATNCQESMEAEEREERWIEEVMAQKVATEVFHGPAFTMSSSEAVTVIASEAERQSANLEALAQVNRTFRAHYSNDQHVAVPFLLTGSVSLKTGELHLCKSHYRYVHNAINYHGTLSAIVRGVDGEEERVHASELHSVLEETPAAELSHRLRSLQLSMDSDFSVAVIDLQWLEEEELRLAKEAAAEALEAEAAHLRQLSASSLFSCFAAPAPMPTTELQFDIMPPAVVQIDEPDAHPPQPVVEPIQLPHSVQPAEIVESPQPPPPKSFSHSPSHSELHLEEQHLHRGDSIIRPSPRVGSLQSKQKKKKRGIWSSIKHAFVCNVNQIEC